MTDYFEPVSFETHRTLRWSHPETYEFTAGLHFVPLIAPEVLKAAQYYRICLLPLGAALRPVVLLAGEDGSNLYLRPDGTWLVPYLPFLLRTFPLRLIRQVDRDEMILAAAKHAATVNDLAGTAFYDDAGALTEKTLAAAGELYRAVENDQAVFTACNRLVSEGLTELLASPAERTPPASWRRLLRISSERLAAIDKERVADLYGESPEAVETAVAVCFSWNTVPRIAQVSTPAPEPPMVGAEPYGLQDDDLVSLLDFGETLRL